MNITLKIESNPRVGFLDIFEPVPSSLGYPGHTGLRLNTDMAPICIHFGVKDIELWGTHEQLEKLAKKHMESLVRDILQLKENRNDPRYRA